MTSPYQNVPLRIADEPVGPLLDWARHALTDAGYRPADEPDAIRRRSWSIVLRLPTERGPVWVKANAREFAYEAALLALIDAQVPGSVLPPIAVRADVGWFISPDGGSGLRADGRPINDQEWHQLLTGYADLQRAMAAQLAELHRIGLLDCAPHTLPGWYLRALARADREPNVVPLLADRRAELDTLIPATRRWADELAASRVPLSIEHNDLHADNVFTPTADRPGLRIFDWGDAAISHPFTGLRRALLTAAGTEEELVATPESDVLRDAYLDRWLTGSDLTAAELQRDADLAGRLSWIVLAASWLRLPQFDEEFGGYYAEILLGYLDATG